MPRRSHVCPTVLYFLEGEQPYLGDLLTMVINHLLTGMILQVYGHKHQKKMPETILRTHIQIG